MKKLIAHTCKANGKPAWSVSLPKSLVGKRMRVYRETKEAAIADAQALVDEHGKFGSEMRQISVAERAFMLHWRKKFSLDEMEAALREKEKETDAQKSLTVEKAAGLYKATKAGMKKESIHDVTWRLKDFAAAFQARTFASIKPGELDIYLRRKNGSGPNFFRVLRAFFNYGVLHDWRADNPILKVPTPEGAPAMKEVWTPAKLAMALHSAAGFDGSKQRLPALTLFVLSAFFGLRYSEAIRARWEDLNFETGELHVKEMKTAKKGIAERWPRISPVARLWLKFIGIKKSGLMITITSRNLSLQRNAILREKKLGKWLHNHLRRGFASHHLAAFEDAAKTAHEMGHTDAKTTLAKYNKARRKKDGLAWFGLTPVVVKKNEKAAEDDIQSSPAAVCD